MKDAIGSQLDRIIPTEILKIEKDKRAIIGAQAVVKAEVGGRQGSISEQERGDEADAALL